MSLHRLVCLCGLLMVSSIGCCHPACVSYDGCSPCGGGYTSGGCGSCGGCESCGSCFASWLRNKFSCCSRRGACRSYGWSSDCCSVCGGSNCGFGSPSGGMSPYGGAPSSGCGCGQSHGYAPSTIVPPNEAPPAPVPANSGPSPRTNEPIPAPGATDSTTFQAPGNGQVQHVSMEEFQRLPGVVVQGPGQAAAAPMQAPTLSTISSPPRMNSGVQQAQWVPAK